MACAAKVMIPAIEAAAATASMMKHLFLFFPSGWHDDHTSMEAVKSLTVEMMIERE